MEGGGVAARLTSMAAMTAMMILVTSSSANATMIKVGNATYGWAPNYINFTEWANHQPFYVGVWIGFWYVNNRQQFNVLEVNKTSYENCNDKDYMKNITGGAGRDVYQLNEAKTYYFLSGGGYCWGGLKIAVNVKELPPAAAPVPKEVSKASPSLNAGIQFILPILFCIMVTIFKFYF